MSACWVDFSRAGIFWQLAEGGSESFFAVEALLDFAEVRWHLGSTVMAGNVYREDMPKLPPYAFTFAASERRWVRFRNGCTKGMEDDSGERERLFRELRFVVPEVEGAPVETGAVFKMAREGKSFMGTVAFSGNEPALLRFPVKHINLHPDGRRWQVETGPLLCPVQCLNRFAMHYDPLAFPVALCYVFFRQDGHCSALVRHFAAANEKGAGSAFTALVDDLGKAVLFLPEARKETETT